MKPTAFAAEVNRRLRHLADPRVKEGAERYFKYKVKFIGVKTPLLREVVRSVEPMLQDRPVDALIKECFALMRSEWAEEQHVAIAILSRNVKRLPPDFLRKFEPVFDRTVHDWAACDHIAGRILRPLLGDGSARKTIIGWRLARSSWRQRVAAVAFVNEARHGEHNRGIVTICSALVKNPDRFAQLGMGWVLRELFLADDKIVLAFLRRHYHRINREALRYAIEKMPASLQKQVLAEHRVTQP